MQLAGRLFRDYYGFDIALPAFLQGECYDKRPLFKTESLMTGVRSRAARPAETSGSPAKMKHGIAWQ